MNTKYYKCKAVIFNELEYKNVLLKTVDNKIEDVLSVDTEIEKDAEFIDKSDYIIAPGYVDTHIHGIAGADIMDCSVDSVITITKEVLKHGVTSYLPTTLTSSVELIRDACQAVAKAKNQISGKNAARIEGIFLEGPFFTEKYKGAQNPKYFIDPDIEVLKDWKKASEDLVLKVALAPEKDTEGKFVKEARKEGVYVALGHSDATFKQANACLDAGANIFVHTYNGMSGLHHRDPAMVGAALLSPEHVYCEAICDGIHMHPSAFELIHKCKGSSIALVTDCMMAGGMAEGQYKLGEFNITVKDGAARLESGALAGSVLLLKDAVKNVVKWGICDYVTAINMATAAPAKSVGIDDRCGILRKGRNADFNILDDELNVVETYLDNQKVY